MSLTLNDLQEIQQALSQDPPESAARTLLKHFTVLGASPLPAEVCEAFVAARHERLPQITRAFLELEEQVHAFPRAFYVQVFSRMMPGDVLKMNSQLDERSPCWRAVMMTLQGIPALASFPKSVVWLMRAISESDRPVEMQHLDREREVEILREDVHWTLKFVKLSSAGSDLARLAGRAPVPLPQDCIAFIAKQDPARRRMMGWSMVGHGTCHLSPEIAQLLLPDLKPESVRALLNEINDEDSYRSTLEASAAVDYRQLCTELLKDRRASRALLDWVIQPTAWINPSVPDRLTYFFDCGFRADRLIAALSERASNVLLPEPQDVRISRLEYVVRACEGRLHEIGPALVEYGKHNPMGPYADSAARQFISMPQMFPASGSSTH